MKMKDVIEEWRQWHLQFSGDSKPVYSYKGLGAIHGYSMIADSENFNYILNWNWKWICIAYSHEVMKSHTRTVVRECFKGDEASNGKGQNSTPRHTKTPSPIFTKIGRRDYVLDGTRHAKFCSDWFTGFCSPNTWFCRALVCSFFGGVLQ